MELYEGAEKQAAVSLIKSNLPWADIQGLNPQERAFQQTHPNIRARILGNLLAGNHRTMWKRLADIHHTQNQVDQARAAQGRPNPYTHPSQPQPWSTWWQQRSQTMQLPLVQAPTPTPPARGRARVPFQPTVQTRPRPRFSGFQIEAWLVDSKPIFNREMAGPSGKLQKLMDNMTQVDPDPHLSDLYNERRQLKDHERLAEGKHGFAGGYTPETDENGGVAYHKGGMWTNADGKRQPLAHVIKPVLAANPERMTATDPRQEVQYFGVSSLPGDEGQLYRTLQEAVNRPLSLPGRRAHPGRGDSPKELSEGFRAQQGRRAAADAMWAEANALATPYEEVLKKVALRPKTAVSDDDSEADLSISFDPESQEQLEDVARAIEDQKRHIHLPDDAPTPVRQVDFVPGPADLQKLNAVDESGLKAAGIAVIAMDTGRLLMLQRALNPLHCPCGLGVTWDEQNGYQHDDGSVDHDGEFYGQSVSDLLDQGHPEPTPCPCCQGTGDNLEGSECVSCDGSGSDPDSPPCDPPCREDDGLVSEAAQNSRGEFVYPEPHSEDYDHYLTGIYFERPPSASNAGGSGGQPMISLREEKDSPNWDNRWDGERANFLDVQHEGRGGQSYRYVPGCAGCDRMFGSAHPPLPEDHELHTDPWNAAYHPYEPVKSHLGKVIEVDADLPHLGKVSEFSQEKYRYQLVTEAALEYDQNEGRWEFPGGKIDAGEAPREAAVREFREEVGQDLPPGVFVGAWVSPGGKVSTFSQVKTSDHSVTLALSPESGQNLTDGIDPQHTESSRFGSVSSLEKVSEFLLVETSDHSVTSNTTPILDGADPRALGQDDEQYGIDGVCPTPGRGDDPALQRTAVKQSPFGDQMDFQVLGWQPEKPGETGRYIKNNGGFQHQAEFGDDENSPTGYVWRLNSFAGDHMINGATPGDWGETEHSTPAELDARSKEREREFYEKSIRGGEFKPPLSQDRPVMIPSEDDHNTAWSPESTAQRWEEAQNLKPAKMPEHNPWNPLNPARLSSFGSEFWRNPEGWDRWKDPEPGSPLDYWRNSPGFDRSEWPEESSRRPSEKDVMTGVAQPMYTLKGVVPEWDSEGNGDDIMVKQWKPEDASHPLHHLAAAPVYKCFIYLIQNERDIDLGARAIANPDDPDGDMSEQVAWWDIEHAKKNPALRPEVKKGTPWGELELWADKSVRANKEVKEALASLRYVDSEESPYRTEEGTQFWRYRDAELEPPAHEYPRWPRQLGENESHVRSVDVQPMFLLKPQTDYNSLEHFDRGLAGPKTNVEWHKPICETCYLQHGYTIPADQHANKTTITWVEGGPEPHDFKPMTPDVDEHGNLREASAKTAMPLTQDVPTINRTIRAGEPSPNSSEYSEARVDDTTLPSGDWIRKLPQYRHLTHEEYRSDPEDVQYFTDEAGREADLEEFASRLGRVLSNPGEEPIAPEAVRGQKSSDPSPAVYVRKYPNMHEMRYTYSPGVGERFRDTPRGKLIGYFHSVLGDGDKVGYHNMGLLGDRRNEGSMTDVSIDHAASSLPLYADALAGKDRDEAARMAWHHEFGLSPYEHHFLVDELGPRPQKTNPLAPGDTERALAASETLRPWAQERGREDWLDAAQRRMSLLGQRAAGTESMFPYQMAHEQMQHTAGEKGMPLRPRREAYPLMRELISAAFPDYSLRTPAEVNPAHEEAIRAASSPSFYERENSDMFPDTPRVYAHISKGTGGYGFVAPLKNNVTGSRGWVRGHTAKSPSEWKFYPNSQLTRALEPLPIRRSEASVDEWWRVSV